MKVEINGVDRKYLSEIVKILKDTNVIIKVTNEEKSKTVNNNKKIQTIDTSDNGGYVPWQERWEDLMTQVNWGR